MTIPEAALHPVGPTRATNLESSLSLAIALETARTAGVYMIGRAQEKRDASIVVINGSTEHMALNRLKGIGIQAFTPTGFCGFAASDNLADAVKVTEAAARLAWLAAERGLEPNLDVFAVPPLVTGDPSAPTEAEVAGEGIYSLPDQEMRLKELNAAVRGNDCRLSVRSSFIQVRDHWQVVRSDGTDCSIPMVRARLSHEITAREGNNTATVNAGVVGMDATLLHDSVELERLARRSRRVTSLALALLTAPTLPGGSYRLVIDYGLAKGLAHEAFGHAAETDAMDTSILGTDGKFRVGERVAPDFVSILDGPLPGDYANQAISANGEIRETIHIVKDGLLHQALADTFSAGRAGVAPTGAARAESYACLPMPRMTNTRIEVRAPLPLALDFDEVTPAAIRDVLLANGLMEPGEQVLYLTGYKGGQVNTTLGDFVFNCVAIYDLADLTLYQPAIFSGKVLSVLGAIQAGIGPSLTNAPGTCGKRGQSVPSSGGCHAFLVIDAHPDVKVGGKA